jgi:parallel beta-helix repeat protein
MKARIPIILMVGVCGLILTSKSGFAQGSLTPPGPPAPTMLTLTQVEPRTPVDPVHTGSGGSSEYLITQPGSYYLTSNVIAVAGLHGINISASDVTLDLRGFSVIGSSSGLDGIYIHSGYTNVTVYNGKISGWNNTSSYGNGVESYADNVTLEHLDVSANHGFGITLNGSGMVRNCNAEGNNNSGINASYNCIVSGCNTSYNGEQYLGQSGGISVGDHCTVIGCTAESNGTNGIYAADDCTVKDCSTSLNLTGIYVLNNSTVKDCTANTNESFGILANNNCLIAGNRATGNRYIGIYITGVQNRIDNNNAGSNGAYGISVQSINVDNNITRNFAPGNGSGGYGNFPGNHDYAPTGTPDSTATGPWYNFQ